jgi:hypothetical protein
VLRTARRRLLLTTAVAVALLSSPLLETSALASDVADPTALTIATSASRLTYGTDLTVTGRLTSLTTTAPIPAAAVSLFGRLPGTTAYVAIASSTSDVDGVVRFVLRPSTNADYVLRYAGTAVSGASESALRRVDVAPNLTLTSAVAVRVGTTVTIRGSVSPPRPGQTVQIQRYYSGAWHLVTSRALSSSSTFAVAVPTPTAKGWLSYRVTKAATPSILGAVRTLPRIDNYVLHTYVVRTKGTITVSMADFAASVAATYGDQRGWLRAHRRFARVSTGGAFTVVMSEAKYLPTFAAICSVQYSCRAGRYVVINQDRWRLGSRYFPGPLTQYRQMVVNHETGHWLGNGHRYCAGAGQLAPVMQQQSKGMQGCKPNAWPLPYEL